MMIPTNTAIVLLFLVCVRRSSFSCLSLKYLVSWLKITILTESVKYAYSLYASSDLSTIPNESYASDKYL